MGWSVGGWWVVGALGGDWRVGVRGIIVSYSGGWPYFWGEYRFTTAHTTAALLIYRTVVSFHYRTFCCTAIMLCSGGW